MSTLGTTDFGEKGTQVPLVASGNEEINFLKHLCKVAKVMGAKQLTALHGWLSEKAQDSLLGGADTHKTIDFLLEICAKTMRIITIREFKDSEYYFAGETLTL